LCHQEELAEQAQENEASFEKLVSGLDLSE
jgi:hypothetical protein